MKNPPAENRRVVISLRGSGLFVNLGKSALNVTAAQATGAHVHPAGSAVHHHANALYIGRPDPVALAIGMADIIAIQRALFANLTILSHGKSPPYWSVLHIKLV